mgnify:CR=1 FL=1
MNTARIFLLLFLSLLFISYAAADELTDAYKKEFAFLKAQKEELSERLTKEQKQQTVELSAARNPKVSATAVPAPIGSWKPGPVRDMRMLKPKRSVTGTKMAKSRPRVSSATPLRGCRSSRNTALSSRKNRQPRWRARPATPTLKTLPFM